MKTAIYLLSFTVAGLCGCFLVLRKSYGDLWFEHDLSMGALSGDIRELKDRVKKLESKAGRKNDGAKTTQRSKR